MNINHLINNEYELINNLKRKLAILTIIDKTPKKALQEILSYDSKREEKIKGR